MLAAPSSELAHADATAPARRHSMPSIASIVGISEGLPLANQNLMDHEYIAVGPLLPLHLLMANP